MTSNRKTNHKWLTQKGFAFIPIIGALLVGTAVTPVITSVLPKQSSPPAQTSVTAAGSPVTSRTGGSAQQQTTAQQQSATANPSAQQSSSSCSGYTLGVPLGQLTCVPKGEEAFRAYVLGLYTYILGLAVVLAAIISTYAGYLYLTSAGDPAKQTHARELIIGALSGLALLILAATVLRFIGIGANQPSAGP